VAIIDAEKGVTAPDQTVISDDRQIKKIAEQSKIDILENAMVIHGHGLYLMPDLVDTHVHYLDAPVFGSLMIVNKGLLVRDMGMSNEPILPLRDQLSRRRYLLCCPNDSFLCGDTQNVILQSIISNLLGSEKVMMWEIKQD
jgi:hypothetical protein